MTIEARTASGETLQFPDGTPDEVIDRTVRNHVQMQPRQRGVGEDLLRQTGLGARYIMQGLARPVGFVGDIVNEAVNLPIRGANWALREAYPPTLSSQITGERAPQIPELGRMSPVIQRGIDAITPTPENVEERRAEAVNTELVSLLGPYGAVRMAQRAGQTIPALAQTVLGRGPARVSVPTAAPGIIEGGTGAIAGSRGPTLASRVGEAFVAAPGTQIAGTVGGAIGGQAARELAPGSTLAEIGGTGVGLLGGTTAALAARLAGNVTRGLLSPMTRPGQERIIGDALLQLSSEPRTLQSRLGSNAHPNEYEIIPGSRRTTAEVAEDPALYGVERSVRSSGGPDAVNDFAIRDAQRNAARREALELAPPVARSEAGDVLQEALAAGRARSAENVSNLYNVVPEEAGRFSAATLYERIMPSIQRVYGRRTEANPPELRPIINRLANAGTLVYGDLRAMASEMGDLVGTARMAGNRTLAAEAGRIKATIEEMMDAGLTPAQAEAHRTAVAARRTQGATFERRAVGRAIAENEFGEPRMVAEAVPPNLTAGPTAARQTLAALDNNPQALAALRGSFVRTMQDAIQAPGAVDAAGAFTDSAANFHRFIRSNEDTVRVLFGPQGVERLQTIARDFASRQAVDTVGRAIGSNTVQNLSTANVVAAAMGGIITPAQLQANPLFRPLTVLYRWAGSETALRELLSQAMLDPFLASTLVQRATPDAVARAAAMINHSLARRMGRVAAQGGRPLVPATLRLPTMQQGVEQ